MKVLTVCLSPTFQKTLVFNSFREDEVNRSSEYMLSVAGKGINVSRTLLRLGTGTEHLTHLGGPRVEEFLSYCSSYGIPVLYAKTESPVRTCVTVINKEKGTSTELVEESRPVEEGTEERLLALYSKEIGRFDAVTVSGNKAAGYSARLYPELVRIAKEEGKLMVLDARGADLLSSVPYGPDIIKPNLSEFASTFLGLKGLAEGDANESLRESAGETARKLYQDYGIRTVISRGRFDTWCYDGKAFESIPVPKAEAPVVNTTGCGDTLTGAMTHALLQGMGLSDAVAFGMREATERAARTEL